MRLTAHRPNGAAVGIVGVGLLDTDLAAGLT